MVNVLGVGVKGEMGGGEKRLGSVLVMVKVCVMA